MGRSERDLNRHRLVAGAGALVGLFAFVLSMVITLRNAWEFGGSGLPEIANYMSTFTALSNLAVLVSFASFAIASESRFGQMILRPVVQAGVAQCIAVTLLVSFFILGVDNPLAGPGGLAGHLQHLLLPVYFLAFWFVVLRDGTLRRSDLWKWLVFPLGYVGYTLARGSVTGWYPYSFLDVGTVGYAGVVGNVLFLSLFFIVLGFATVVVDRPPAERGDAGIVST